MKELMRVHCRLDSDLFTTIRLTTGGLCSLVGLNLDDSEDCKVCVTESLLMLLRSGYGQACITFEERDGLFVRVLGEGERRASESSLEDEIAYALLSALVAELDEVKEDGFVREVSFRFGR